MAKRRRVRAAGVSGDGVVASVGPNKVACTLNSTQLFESVKVEQSLVRSQLIEHKPISAVTSEESQVKFYIPGTSDSFIDLSMSQLRIIMKIVKEDGEDLADDDVVTTVQLPIATMFNQIDMEINGKSVSSNTKLYGYRAIIETVIESGRDECWMTPAGYHFTDEGDQKEDPAFFTAFTPRYAKSGQVEIQGPLFLDLFTQNKMIPPQCAIMLRMTRSSNDFALYGKDATKKYRIKIKDMSLMLTHCELQPEYRGRIERNAMTKLMQFPMKQIEMRSYMIGRGSFTHTEHYAYMGRIPRRLVFGMVRDVNASGSVVTDPFLFEHFNLSHIEVTLNGIAYPSHSVIIDMSNPPWSAGGAYAETMQALGKLSGAETGLTITKWATNKFLIATDFHLGMGADSDCLVRNEKGQLSVNLQFAEPIVDQVQLVLYIEMNGVLQMDGARNIIRDTM